ncbi:MAG: hypothetical protein Q7S40_27970 [Opitutaceae bacterium]|nr:hypothetical protein [Opitutaceae bacterium]
MKRHLLLLTLGASLLTASYLSGQSKSASAATPAPPQKLVRIATLNTPEANREFQANVQLMQTQRQNAVELNAMMEKETDPKKKAALKTQLDQVMTKLTENNEKMLKAYGFSLTRHYTMEVVTSNIYMFVTDEEAAKIEQAEKAKAAGKTKAPKAKK